MTAIAMPSASIVLIDDDDALRDALVFSLEAAGMTVLAFADAETALAEPLPPDACLVIDQRLPGLTGLEAFQRLRLRGDQNPTILITSHPTAQLRRAAAACGVAIIEKPLLGDSLLRALKTLQG